MFLVVLHSWELNQTESNGALFQPLQTQNISQASREKLVFSVKEDETVNQIGPDPSKTLTGGTESKYCLSRGKFLQDTYININI